MYGIADALNAIELHMQTSLSGWALGAQLSGALRVLLKAPSAGYARVPSTHMPRSGRGPMGPYHAHEIPTQALQAQRGGAR